MKARYPTALLCLLVFAQYANAADPFLPADAPRPDFWDTDGVIHAVVATNNVVYVGGKFSYVAPKGTKAAAVDVYTGERVTEFPAIIGTGIHAIIEDGHGGWFIGGEFVEVGGLPRTNLVRVLSDNRVDLNFAPNPDNAVHALALDGNILFVGGDFTFIGGEARSRVAAFDLAANAVSAWKAEADDRVSVLLLDGRQIYVGGAFNEIGEQPRAKLAALDTGSGRATEWSPQSDGDVLTLALRDERLFVGGFFNQIGGQLRNGLAALDTATALAVANWNPDPSGGKVTVLRAVCDTVFVGGYFTNMGGVARHRVAAIDANTATVTDWDAKLGLAAGCGGASSISSLEVVGNKVYLAGEFASVGSEPRRDLAAVDLTTGEVLPWNPDLNGGATVLAVAGRTVLAGFAVAPGGVERCNLAAFDAVTGRATDWDPAADGAVLALAWAGNRIYAGGGFANVGGLPRSRIAAIDAASGAAVPDWTNSANGDVLTLAVSGSTLFAGGAFTTMNGVIRHRLAALDLEDGSLLNDWVPLVSGEVHTLAPAEGFLYVGGYFDSIGPFFRFNLAALDLTTGEVLTWDPQVNGPVHALAFASSVLYVGGDFTRVGGVSRPYVAAIDGGTGQVVNWNPAADNPVHALAVSGTAIYAGGIFRRVGGAERSALVALDHDGQLLDWNPGASATNQIFAMAHAENALYVAGRNGLTFGASSDLHALGVFPQVGAPVATQAPLSQRVPLGQTVELSVATAGQAPLFYQWQFEGSNLPGQTNATLLLTNLQVAQSGRYQVVVTNTLGAVTAEATLTVLQAVSITAQPVSQTLSPGATAILNVSASGNPPPLYQWRLNGVNIPGAVFPTLTLTNVTPASGGSYQVVLFNGVSAVSSDIATILVPSAPLPFTDQFASAGMITAQSGVGSGSNLGATNEAGEPRHVGKLGGASVWLSWIAPADGIATFDTRGSSFDTLLAIYTGTDLSSPLKPTAADDDRGGFLTSRASFNAIEGIEYRIAIDGLGGASGNIVLRWDLDTNALEFPRITADPLTHSVTNGGTVVFGVEAASPTPLRYQWFFGCLAIRGATNDTLTISNAQTRHVGSYRVIVMNASERVAESLAAALEIGPFPTAFSYDKYEDALADLVGGKRFRASSSGAFLVSMGIPVSQTFSTDGYTTELCEANYCGVPGGASALLRFQAEQNGVVQVDTIGSALDTVLAVYGPPFPLSCFAQNLVACDDNGAPDGIRSLIQFTNSVPGRTYIAVVDGVGGAAGLVSMRWQLGLAPVVVTNAGDGGDMIVGRGTNLTLRVSLTNAVPLPSYQWQLDGLALPGATNSTLELTNLQGTQSGTYSVVVSNFAGMVIYTSAKIVVDVALRLEGMTRGGDGQMSCVVLGNPGQNYVLQASTNLMDWTVLMTNAVSANYHDEFVDRDAWRYPHRFYRALPWVPLHLRSQFVRTSDAWYVRLTAIASHEFVLEATTNLSHWIPLRTNASPGIPLDFLDWDATNYAVRFYRLRPWP